jgi:hypothetical protein
MPRAYCGFGELDCGSCGGCNFGDAHACARCVLTEGGDAGIARHARTSAALRAGFPPWGSGSTAIRPIVGMSRWHGAIDAPALPCGVADQDDDE